MNTYSDCAKCPSFPNSAFSCIKADLASKTVSADAIMMTYKKGQVIFQEGTPAKGVFCIQKGKVKIFKKCVNRNITIELASNSDLVGYTALFNGGVYSNSAQCLEDTNTCFIPAKQFQEVLQTNHQVLMQLMERTCVQNLRLSNYLRDFKCRNMLSRIVTTLMNVADKFGYDSDKCINIALTRKEISEISGTTTESAIRILNELKKEKLISFHNNRIKIHDLSKLQRYQASSSVNTLQ